MSIDKQFTGGLSATSQGEMLSAMTSTQGIFVLQHFGTMDKGQDSLILNVVPDSGTAELQGLTGSMKIRIEQGVHYYDFEYTL